MGSTGSTGRSGTRATSDRTSAEGRTEVDGKQKPLRVEYPTQDGTRIRPYASGETIDRAGVEIAITVEPDGTMVIPRQEGLECIITAGRGYSVTDVGSMERSMIAQRKENAHLVTPPVRITPDAYYAPPQSVVTLRSTDEEGGEIRVSTERTLFAL